MVRSSFHIKKFFFRQDFVFIQKVVFCKKFFILQNCFYSYEEVDFGKK